MPHCHTGFKKQLRSLVRLLQAKTLILKHLASLNKHLGTSRIETAATCCNHVQQVPPRLGSLVRDGAGWCGCYSEHAPHLHRQWWKGSTHCNKGVHLQIHASDLESQQVDHLNDSHVTSKWNDKDKRIKRQSSTKERQGAVFSHVTSHIKLPTKNMSYVCSPGTGQCVLQ